MPEVVISEYLNESALHALERDFDVHYDPTLTERPDDLAALLGDCRALIVRNRTRVSDAVLAAAPALRIVGRLGVGLDNIDVDACRRRGVEVAPATGANTVSVAEYVIAAVLMLLRTAYQCTAEVLDGDWPRNRYMGREAAGKTLGLVGFGGIGRAVAPRARALGMHVVAYDAHVAASDPDWRDLGVDPVDLDALLARSDAVSLHVPLDARTHHLIDADAIARMRDGAVLINTARGGVVDEAAMADALRAGSLGGAMLDVYEHEPLPAGSPLLGVPRLILTPHIAGVTEESNERVGAMIAGRVRDVLAGDAS